MKFLIWFGCLFVVSAVITFLKVNGVMLGGIPTILLYAGMIWTAKTLCKKWDESHKKPDDEQVA